MKFADSFRKQYGRDPTEADVDRMLAEFGIVPDREGYYHRKDFEKAWALMDQGLSTEEIKKRLRN